MLAEYLKFHFVNNTGVQLDFNGNSANEKIDLYLQGWKFDSNGALSYDQTETNQSYSAADVANAAGAEFAQIDNSTDLYTGYLGRLRVQTDNASADGTVDLYVEWTTDSSGTDYPSDEAQFVRDEDLIFVRSINIVGADSREVNFEIY